MLFRQKLINDDAGEARDPSCAQQIAADSTQNYWNPTYGASYGNFTETIYI